MKRLILVRGSICAGKSTTSRLVRRALRDSSHVDFDVFKMLIDDEKSSEWRRDLAIKIGFSLASELMKLGRTIIVETHSRKYYYKRLERLAKANGYKLTSFLLEPPLEVCLDRNRAKMRDKYKISDNKIKRSWRETFYVPGEIKFDTSKSSPQKIANKIIGIIRTL